MIKKFLLKILISSIIIYSIFFFIINVLIDPYNEIGIFNYSLNKRIVKDSILTYNTLLKKLNNQEQYTLVFGTSRSHLLSEEVLNEKVLNFHSLYGNPKNIFNVLDKLSKKEIHNIKKIYFLLDFHVFNTESYRKFDTNNFFPQMYYLVRNTNSIKIEDSIKMFLLNLTNNNDSYIDRNSGSAIIVQKDEKMKLTKESLKWKPFLKYDEEVFLYLGRIESWCKENNIEIIFFTPTLYSDIIKNFDLDILKKQKELYLKNIDGFYDFTYLDDISNDRTFFRDVSHLNTKGMKALLDKIKFEHKYYIGKDDSLKFKLK
ncbi:MAG: hypothetical protein K8R39_00375 [Arcobacteraceae bacterium]|nr:hypothetical protein [Arcobacteraceae bacterium]